MNTGLDGERNTGRTMKRESAYGHVDKQTNFQVLKQLAVKTRRATSMKAETCQLHQLPVAFPRLLVFALTVALTTRILAQLFFQVTFNNLLQPCSDFKKDRKHMLISGDPRMVRRLYNVRCISTFSHPASYSRYTSQHLHDPTTSSLLRYRPSFSS